MTDGRFAYTRTPAGGSRTDGGMGNATINGAGNLVVMDWMTHAIMMGMGYQVRAGTITTPLVGDVVITDTAAEMCVDALAGYTVIPMSMNVSIRLGTGTLHEYAVKSVGAASTAGTAFIPLPLRTTNPTAGGTASAAVTSARVQAAGAVTVAAELATTTLRHWSWANPVAVGAGNDAIIPAWEPLRPPILDGLRCLYVQIAATGTGPSYYANLDYIEAVTANFR
jgi:hypothetical protein